MEYSKRAVKFFTKRIKVDAKFLADAVEWYVNNNYKLYVEFGRPEISKHRYKEVKLSIIDHGRSVYLDIPHERHIYGKKNYEIESSNFVSYSLFDIVNRYLSERNLHQRVVKAIKRRNERDREFLSRTEEKIRDRVFEKAGEYYGKKYLAEFGHLVKIEER